MSSNRYDLDESEAPCTAHTTAKLLNIGTATYGGDWSSKMHTHAYTEIFYVVGGIGQFIIEELHCPVVKDDIVIINADVAHTEVGGNSSPLEYIICGIDGLQFSIANENDERFCVVNFQGESESILKYFNMILSEIDAKDEGYAQVCQNLLQGLLILLKRRANFLLMPAQPGEKSIKNCAAVRRYIDRHFKEDITLEQLADLAHFNKYYMAHSFSQQYGISPINYLITRRVQESKYLLNDTNLPLSDISNLLGFSSPSYFSQSFRKVEGISPLEFRRQHRLI